MIKYLSLKDRKRRLNYLKFETERLRLKSIIYNQKLPLNIRIFFVYKLDLMSKNASLTRLKNRCILTNRGHSVYRFFHLSRISIKEYLALNQLSNIKTSSW